MIHAKVSYPLDKKHWHPSVLPGQIVLVTTMDCEEHPNVAPKSWVAMVAFQGPTVAFGCNVEHRTFQNIEETRAFTLTRTD